LKSVRNHASSAPRRSAFIIGNVAATRAILHVDMDAFFASIEQRDRPELRGKPVLVGGSGPRGVVTAASYEARPFGCHSAQPMAQARRLCPQAIIMPVRGRVYRDVSTQVFDILEAYTPLVQPLSVDEGFLDVTGSQRLLGEARAIAEDIRRRVRSELDLTCSVGIAPNKFLAKLASSMNKPDAITIIEADRVRETLVSLPIGMMWGVGPVTEQRLQSIGILTFGDVLGFPLEALESHVGSYAHRLKQLAAGEDERSVTPDSRAKSISHEQTFSHDLAEPAAVREVLLEETDAVARRLRRHQLAARSVTVKIRFGDYETITRSSTLPEASDRTDVLWRAASALFDHWARETFQPVRLIGMAAGNLGQAQSQLHLFTHHEDAKRRSADRAADLIQARFGRDAIHRGLRTGTNDQRDSPQTSRGRRGTDV
jgi:DNA polymerase-4